MFMGKMKWMEQEICFPLQEASAVYQAAKFWVLRAGSAPEQMNILHQPTNTKQPPNTTLETLLCFSDSPLMKICHHLVSIS